MESYGDHILENRLHYDGLLSPVVKKQIVSYISNDPVSFFFWLLAAPAYQKL